MNDRIRFIRMVERFKRLIRSRQLAQSAPVGWGRGILQQYDDDLEWAIRAFAKVVRREGLAS